MKRRDLNELVLEDQIVFNHLDIEKIFDSINDRIDEAIKCLEYIDPVQMISGYPDVINSAVKLKEIKEYIEE